MKFLKNKRGFTLIELLVVISIIGVLSTIVLGSVGEGRERAKYIKVKSGIRQLQSQAELFYSENGTYGTFTPSSSVPCPSSISSGTPSHIFEEEKFFNMFSDLAKDAGIEEFNNDDYIICYASDSWFAFYLFTPFGIDQEQGDASFTLDPEGFGLCIDSYFNINRVPGVGGDAVNTTVYNEPSINYVGHCWPDISSGWEI
ncbi:MAG: type II secretion system GspH family protein [Candidatus Pacebacteria bacterium]|nr:type II secretion system GspH family protein [Candidatus Paceibacterota bacterium]